MSKKTNNPAIADTGFTTPHTLKISPTQVEPAIAKAGVRLVAMLYDGMLILAMLFFVAMLLIVLGTWLTQSVGSTAGEAQALPVWYRYGVLMPAFVITLVGFYGLFWRRGGQTLGMQTWRIKTVTTAGNLLSWSQSCLRILAACVLPILCGLVGFLVYGTRTAVLASAVLGLLFNYGFCWVNRKGLAVHDILSQTMTLKMPKIQHEGIIANFLRERRDKQRRDKQETCEK